MSENRESAAPGDPIEEEISTNTDVLAAARRATGGDPVDGAASADGAVAPVVDDAGETEAFAEDALSEGDAADAAIELLPEPDEEAKRRISEIDTQLDFEALGSGRVEIAEVTEMPSAASVPEPVARAPRDGEVPVDSVDQLAAIYMQTPLPPDLKGNRGPGVLIALLATLVFAVLYAGAISLLIAWEYPPSTFLEEGLLPRILTIGFGAAVVGFFVAQAVLALILGKASWWGYVLGGLFVGVFVWAATFVGGALHDHFIDGKTVSMEPGGLVENYGFLPASLIAGLLAREVSLWFGVWTGSRGRKVKQRNLDALTEYEETLAQAAQKSV